MTTQRNEPAGKAQGRPEERKEPNLGGVRSDYGNNVSGDDRNDQRTQSQSSRFETAGDIRESDFLNDRKGLGKGLLLLSGAGVSAALIYLLRPGQKKGEPTLQQDELLKAKCQDLMTKDPSCCLPADGASKAAQLMRTEDVGAIPVVESHETKRLIGIVTDRDLALKIVAEGRNSTTISVADVMTRNVTSCRASDDLETALAEMGNQQLRRIPIVDDDNLIVGIISQADVATRLEAPRKTADVVEEISKSAAAGK